MRVLLSSFLLAATRVDVSLTVVVSLLLVASLVAIAAFYLRLPYTVALVIAGLAFGLTGVFGNVKLSEQMILLVFVPPLVFDGAINMHLDELRLRWKQVGVLAVPGTIVTAAVIAGALALLPGMRWSAAVLIAVIVAPTDPVSVLAIFKANGVAAGLQTLLEGESLFNDALGIVLYVIAVDVAFPGVHHVSVLGGVGTFALAISVGVVVGFVVGFVAEKLMSTLDDHLVEITLSLVAAYGSYLVADRLHGSGIIAVVVAGLLVGNSNVAHARAESQATMLSFWEVVAFLANSALFLLIGLAFRLGDLIERRTIVAAIVATVAMFAARAVVTWVLLRASPATEIPPRWRTAMFWGGLRGGIPIALVLGLEGRRVGNTNTEALVFAVVLFSLIVQGTTYKPLLRRLHLSHERTRATPMAP
jgi:monovalent cation:H+ antiporter, CPA1 family